MTRISRVLLALAAALIPFASSVPLWRIRLVAPQYPEGLGMEISARTVRGVKEHDLENINHLNHYIGMRVIEPEGIPELRLIPWVIGGLAVAGVIAAAVGRRPLAVAWLVSFAVLGAIGMWDFRRWQIDYGTNLAPDAIIQVPGMTYQPPLIGTKQLLNFTATSWPAIGSFVLAAAFALGMCAIVVARRRSVRYA
jgi:copper chaperone NosL